MSDPLPPAIRRGRIDQLTIYEITEDELQTLASGGPESVYFNLAIFFGSIAGTAVVSLATTQMAAHIFVIFVVVAAATTIAAIVLIAIWRRQHVGSATVVGRIKERLPPEGQVIHVHPVSPTALTGGTATEIPPSVDPPSEAGTDGAAS